MRKYNGINRKKIMFIFGMVLIIATSFFYLNNARMDDFTSLMTDTTLQYQEEGSMKDYTTDVYLKDQTPLSITIKATLPKGTLATIEETDNTIVKNETLTYSLPEQLKVEDVQADKLYLEDDLVNSIGSYEIKNNVLTMSFDEEQINTNAETELKIALVLDTDSSHITYDTNGSATLLFNNKKIVLNKYVEQPQETTIVQQIDEQIVEKEKRVFKHHHLYHIQILLLQLWMIHLPLSLNLEIVRTLENILFLQKSARLKMDNGLKQESSKMVTMSW